jgi:acyl carrier protein
MKMATPTPQEVNASVKEALSKHLEIPLENIKDESNIRDDLGLDSFGMVELLFELEDAAGIKIPDGQMPDIRTVQDLVGFIHKTLSDDTTAPAQE